MLAGLERTFCAIKAASVRQVLQPPLTGTIERSGTRASRKCWWCLSRCYRAIETLHEYNIEARTRSQDLGIVTFRMMPAVGDSPLFIAALKDLVLRP